MMEDEKNAYFKIFLLLCLIAIGIEIALFVWSNIQVSNFSASEIEAIKLAQKGVLTFGTLFFGNLITAVVSIFIPQYGVFKLYHKINGHQYYWVAKILLLIYIVLPIANTAYSISGACSLLKDASISIFQMISYII